MGDWPSCATGETISIDAVNNRLDFQIDDEELGPAPGRMEPGPSRTTPAVCSTSTMKTVSTASEGCVYRRLTRVVRGTPALSVPGVPHLAGQGLSGVLEQADIGAGTQHVETGARPAAGRFGGVHLDAGHLVEPTAGVQDVSRWRN